MLIIKACSRSYAFAYAGRCAHTDILVLITHFDVFFPPNSDQKHALACTPLRMPDAVCRMIHMYAVVNTIVKAVVTYAFAYAGRCMQDMYTYVSYICTHMRKHTYVSYICTHMRMPDAVMQDDTYV